MRCSLSSIRLRERCEKGVAGSYFYYSADGKVSEGSFRDLFQWKGEASWFAERRDRLMQVSAEFRKWWPQHDIEDSLVGYKEFQHPHVGTLNLRSTTLLVAAHPNLKMFVYMPVDGMNTTEKLVWLVQAAAVKPEVAAPSPSLLNFRISSKRANQA